MKKKGEDSSGGSRNASFGLQNVVVLLELKAIPTANPKSDLGVCSFV